MMNPRSVWQIVGLFGALSGCGGYPSVANADNANAPDVEWATTCPIPFDAPRDPLNLEDVELSARYGSPATADRFILGQAIDPVRMSVRNTLSAPADLHRLVREMRWKAEGCELRVWLVQRGDTWRAVHTMRSPIGGEH